MSLTTEAKPRRIPPYLWLISRLIGGFYLLSAAGWYVATYAMHTGKLGPEVNEFVASLNIIDHVVRHGQVILVSAGSVMLLGMNHWAFRLFSIATLCSLVSVPLASKWGISFLSPFLLIPVWLYLLLLRRYSFLRGPMSTNQVDGADATRRPAR